MPAVGCEVMLAVIGGRVGRRAWRRLKGPASLAKSVLEIGDAAVRPGGIAFLQWPIVTRSAPHLTGSANAPASKPASASG
jgi:hypothetical protein